MDRALTPSISAGSALGPLADLLAPPPMAPRPQEQPFNALLQRSRKASADDDPSAAEANPPKQAPGDASRPGAEEPGRATSATQASQPQACEEKPEAAGQADGENSNAGPAEDNQPPSEEPATESLAAEALLLGQTLAASPATAAVAANLPACDEAQADPPLSIVHQAAPADATGPEGQLPAGLPVLTAKELATPRGDAAIDLAGGRQPAPSAEDRTKPGVPGVVDARLVVTTESPNVADATEQIADEGTPGLGAAEGEESAARKAREVARRIEEHSARPSSTAESDPAVRTQDLAPPAAQSAGADSGALPAPASATPSGPPTAPDLAAAIPPSQPAVPHPQLPVEALAVNQHASGRHAVAEADTARLLGRVARAFAAAWPQNGEVRLRLSPPELGALRLAVQIHESGMVARLEVETPAARSVLVDNLPALRQRLAEQGMRIERFDVDLMQRQFGGTPGGPHERQQREGGLPALAASHRPPVTARPLPLATHDSHTLPAASPGRLNVIV